MKQKLFLTIALLMAVCSFSKAATKEAYAVISDEGKTLTFYYDNNKNDYGLNAYDLNIGSTAPGWTDYRSVITKAVIDPSFQDARPKSTAYWFDCSKLTSIVGLEYLNTSEVLYMSSMFSWSQVTSLDLSHFDTQKVYDMNNMFEFCEELTFLDLTSFDTGNVYNMTNMFFHCGKLQTIVVGDGWNTDNVEESDFMFGDCTALMGGRGTPYDPDIIDKSLARIDDGFLMGYLSVLEAYAVYTAADGNYSNNTLRFYYDGLRIRKSGVTYDLNTGSNKPEWITEHGNDIERAVIDRTFQDARPTSTAYWFACANLFDITAMDYLNTSKVKNMSYMFNGCKAKELNLRNFETRAVTNMSNMFNSCKELTSLNLTSFFTVNVTNMSKMFYFCNKLKSIYVSDRWDTRKVSKSDQMFGKCTQLIGGEGTHYTVDKLDATYACIDGGESNPGYLSARPSGYAVYYNKYLTFYNDGKMDEKTGETYLLNIDSDEKPGWVGKMSKARKVVFDESFATARPVSTYSWFDDFPSVDVVGWENLNTSKVTYMNCMFRSCRMNNLDISHFDTQNVTNMNMMFSGCQILKTLDLSNFDTSNVTDMLMMFNYCLNLEVLDLSSFDTKNVTCMDFMFSNCSNLETIYVSEKWNTDKVGENGSAMFNNCTSLVGGQGTAFNNFEEFSEQTSSLYARIDGGPDNPGYFTYKKPAGITTGAELQDQVQCSKFNVQSESWYTIDGQKLNGVPAKKGIYIQNGQKVAIK